MIATDIEIQTMLDRKWDPRKFGNGIMPKAGEYGRTTILPALFDDHGDSQMATWRQKFQTTGHMTVMSGTKAGNTLPEDWSVAWVGLALPNKNQHLSEIKWQIGDRKFGRVDLEEIHQYKIPAIIFEEGFIVEEEEAFDLYGYIEPELPDNGPGGEADTIYQRIVLLGAAYFKQVDRALGQCGAAI